MSAQGDYIWTQSGELRWNFGLSATDVAQWKPRFAFAQKFRNIHGKYIYRSDILGTIYLPLILLDQKYLHKTVRFIPLEVTDHHKNSQGAEVPEDDRDFNRDFSLALEQSKQVNLWLTIFGSLATLCCIISLITIVKNYYYARVSTSYKSN